MLQRSDGDVLSRGGARPVLGAVLLACAAGDAPAGEAPGPSGSGAEDSVREAAVTGDTVAGLRVSLATDRASYPPAAPVRMTLSVINAADDAVTLRFPSAQRYDFVVRTAEDDGGAGPVRWRWSEGRMFAQVTGEEALAPGDSLRFEAVLEAGLPSGVYTVEGLVAASNRPIGARLTIRVRE